MNLIQILTNENPVMIRILAILFMYVETLLFCNMTIKLLKIQVSKKQILLYIFFVGLIGNVASLLINNSFSDIVNIFSLIIFTIIIFKQNIKNSFLALITCYIGILVSAFLTQPLLVSMLNIPLNYITDIPLYRLISCVISYFLFYIFTIIVTKRDKLKNFFKLSLKSAIVLNLLCGIVIIFIQSYIFSTYNILSLKIELIIIISLLLYFFITIYSLVRTNKLEETTQNLETEKLYNKTLTVLHDNIRCFKHDFNNIIQALGGYIDLNDMDGLKEYYKKLLEECTITNNLNVLNPETINNPSIYSLLTNKYYLANQKDIQMKFSIFADLSRIGTNIYDLSRILGILLDNAIEAAEESKEKIIEIELKSDQKKILFTIRNSCKDSNISTTKIFEKGYSTKNRNSGIGLWKVHKILSKNTNLDLFTTIDENMFSQQLAIFY